MRSSCMFTLATALLLGACTDVSVRPIDAAKHSVKLICIRSNPAVEIADFVGTLEDGFQRHGIDTQIFESEPPSACEYVLTYTATRGWDLVPFLKHAELRLKQGNTIVGSAIYHHKGGLGLNKWASTESKMTPVIDELLAGFQAH